MELIERQVWQETRSKAWRLRSWWSSGERRWEVAVQRDPYDFQSYARVRQWNGEWTVLVSIPPPLMLAVSFLTTNDDAATAGAVLRNQEGELLELAVRVSGASVRNLKELLSSP